MFAVMTHITLTETNVPHGGVTMWLPKFREMPLAEIESILQEDLQSYAAVGYSIFTFHRATALISIRRAERTFDGPTFFNQNKTRL